MSIILDTSFLIAVNDTKDINHKLAVPLKENIKNGEFGKTYVSDYIFDEFVTFLKARSFPKNLVEEIGDSLLSEKTIELLRVDNHIFNDSWQMFKKFDDLSFTDCTTIVLAKEFGIKKVASFDSGFDRIEYIKRV